MMVHVVQDELGYTQIVNAEDMPELEGPEIPRWAIKAGNIMFAIRTPASRKAGWQAFAIIDAAARRGNLFARKIREGIRRIAVALQRQRG